MTDAREELREAVAKAMWMADIEPYDPADRIPFEEAPEMTRAYCFAEADAAIDLVLERAAKVVTEHYQELSAEHRLLVLNRAAAIRALKEKT